MRYTSTSTIASKTQSKERFSPSLWYCDGNYRRWKQIQSRLDVLLFHQKLTGISSLEVWTMRLKLSKYQKLIDRYLAHTPVTTPGMFNKETKSYRLDNKVLIYRTLKYQRYFKDILKAYPNHQSHCESIYRMYIGKTSRMSKSDRVFWHKISANAKKTANTTYLFRMTQEAILGIENGWYPIFNTLTVNTQSIDHVFEKGSRAWIDHIRSIERQVRIKCFGSTRKNSHIEVLSYFAVVEQGSKNGRLHIHYLMWLKALPDGWSDPNQRFSASIQAPVLREIQEAKQYWSYGFSSPIAVRMSSNDAYSKLGWRYPVSKDLAGNYSAIKATNIGALCNYLLKYLVKDQSSSKGVKLWRVRQTRTHGLKQLKSILKQSKTKHLLIYLKQKAMPVKLGTLKIPTRLWKYQTMRELLKRMGILRKLIYPMMLRSPKRLKPPSRIMTMTGTDPRQQSFTSSPREENSSVMDAFKAFGSLVSQTAGIALGQSGAISVGGISRIYYRT